MPLDLLATRHRLAEDLAAAKARVEDLEGEVAAYDRVIAREGLLAATDSPAAPLAGPEPATPARLDVTRLGAARLHPFILAQLAAHGPLAVCDLMAAFAKEHGLTREEEENRKFRGDFSKAITRLVEQGRIVNRERQGKEVLRAITPAGREWLAGQGLV